MVASNITTVTVSSGGYLFTYSQDAYFTGGVGLTKPVGRSFSVVCPNGVQAQASTAGPTVGNGANITIKRTDEKLFNLRSFTGKILLNTAGAALEIMPQLNDNDAFTDPLMYDCTGYAGMSFPYTTALTGYDSCLIHMWGDFALTHLTLVDASVPPVLECSLTSSNYFSVMWPTNSTAYTLQQSSTLNSNNWTTVTDAPVVSGTNYQLLVNLTNDAGFFRLKQ